MNSLVFDKFLLQQGPALRPEVWVAPAQWVSLCLSVSPSLCPAAAAAANNNYNSARCDTHKGKKTDFSILLFYLKRILLCVFICMVIELLLVDCQGEMSHT